MSQTTKYWTWQEFSHAHRHDGVWYILSPHRVRPIENENASNTTRRHVSGWTNRAGHLEIKICAWLVVGDYVPRYLECQQCPSF